MNSGIQEYGRVHGSRYYEIMTDLEIGMIVDFFALVATMYIRRRSYGICLRSKQAGLRYCGVTGTNSGAERRVIYRSLQVKHAV